MCVVGGGVKEGLEKSLQFFSVSLPEMNCIIFLEEME